MSKNRNKRKQRFKQIQSSLTKVRELTKEIVRLEDLDKDTSEPFNQLFETADWLVDTGASEQMEDIIYSGISDREAEIIKFVINETVYRLECSTDKGEPVTITPFAIPISILVPMEYKSKIESVTGLPNTVVEASSTKLIRKGWKLGDEPSIILDNRLWRSDLPEWRGHVAIRKYLTGIAAYLMKLSPAIQPLTRSKNQYKPTADAKGDEGGYFLITRAFTGVVVSGNDDIDMAIYGYNSVENLPDTVDPPELVFMNEFAVMCEHELESLGIKDAVVHPISPSPMELWEVPENALQFERITDINQKATNAVKKLGGAPINGCLKMVLIGDEVHVKDIKLLAYEEGASQPFFTYIWNIVHELETPASVMEDVVRVTMEVLGISNIEVVGKEIHEFMKIGSSLS